MAASSASKSGMLLTWLMPSRIVPVPWIGRAEHAPRDGDGRLLSGDRLDLVGRFVQVDVRRAGELPGSQVVVVGLPGGGGVELDDVALGVELDERRRVVGADQGRERAQRR